MPITLNELYLKYVEKSSKDFSATIKEGSKERIDSFKAALEQFAEQANKVVKTKTNIMEDEVVLA